jgi:hypothetical protein
MLGSMAGWGNVDMRLVARIVLFTAVLLPACILAADTGSMGSVVLVRVPNGGQAVAAKITEGGTIHSQTFRATEEIAARTALSIDAVKSHLQNGRRMLWLKVKGTTPLK